MDISIIIPTLNEEQKIAETIRILKRRAARPQKLEIIVSDGNSSDNTVAVAQQNGARIVHASTQRRSVQLNEGAEAASCPVLYFLHADTHPPARFDQLIYDALNRGDDAGCFRLTFDRDQPLLNFYGWCTRFNIDLFRFGDQSLFMQAHVFDKTGGFREDYMLLEDQEMVKRIKSKFSFAILPEYVITSSRKFNTYGPLKLQLVYTFLLLMYEMGLAQQKLYKIYKKLLK